MMRQEKIIRRTAKEMGISLRELAARLGITTGYVQDLMHGRALPSLDVIRRMLVHTDGRISVNEILTWQRKAKWGEEGKCLE